LASSSPSEPDGSQDPETGETPLGIEEDDELAGTASTSEIQTVMPLTIWFERALRDISCIWIEISMTADENIQVAFEEEIPRTYHIRENERQLPDQFCFWPFLINLITFPHDRRPIVNSFSPRSPTILLRSVWYISPSR
jgi:hypothetical protein